MDISLHYENVYLKPNFNTVSTRSSIDTEINFLGKTFSLPVIPANMKCCVDYDVCKFLDLNNYFYIMHRFDIDIIKFVEEANDTTWMNNFKTVSISLGIQQKDAQIVTDIASRKLHVDYITIDVAHGHHSKVAKQIEHIKNTLPTAKIIAGNVATFRGVEYLNNAGADAIKVGIGGGYACTTKDKTGFTYPMFSCILECAKDRNIPIIADGGIRCNGDIAKALVAGATMVMCGSIFAACTDSPAPTVKDSSGRRYKQYYGSASIHNKMDKKNIEGTMKLMDTDSFTYEEKLLEITQDLQSAISYAGGCNLKALNLYNVQYGVRM
ncbi:MAG: GMP reductase [Proteobacteria bacterium]|nr:GMP reductase [Pseudomonadota bacterium]NBP13131.1 GMP reductase [bacterium]